MEKKFILLRDPWNTVNNGDSGWGNRLICWEAVSIINQAMGGTHIIKVLPEEYPELLAVDMPNTEYFTPDEWDKEFIHIEESTVLNWIEKVEINLSSDSSYTTNFSFESSMGILRDFYSKKFNIISKLRFRDENLHKGLQSYFKDRIGLHIRRGSGVFSTLEHLQTVPKPYRRYYKLCQTCDKSYPFIEDKFYFDIIDEFISKDKDAKFFIGIDINQKAVKYYKNKYPGKIVTFDEVFKDNKELLEKSEILRPRLQIKDMGKILLDFFGLAYCKVIMGNSFSTWSFMAFRVLNDYTKTDTMYQYSSKELIKESLRYENTEQFIPKSNII